jgi:ComF family protein
MRHGSAGNAGALADRSVILACMALTLPSIARILSDFADFVIPPSCALCGRHGRSPLCSECDGRLEKLADDRACPRCAMSLGAGADCPHCLTGRAKPFTRIARLAPFEDPVRGLIHRLKYQGAWRLAGLLAGRLSGRAIAAEVLKSADVLVPVPLHPVRQIARGYNQAELLADRLGHSFGKRRVRALRRMRNTVSQTALTAIAERHKNVQNAFELDGWPGISRRIRGRRVVLIDDVMTSGATLRSAARALLEASPSDLSAVVVAVADPRERGFQAI